MRQQTLAAQTGFEKYGRKSKRERFLEEMEQVVPWAEDALYESPALRRFAGVDLGRAPVPDESTILGFRHLLEQHELGGAMLNTVNQYLESRGIRITTGTIVDATIIHAPSSTKNRS